MRINTKRLELKDINENHAEDILKIRSNLEINKFLKEFRQKTTMMR
ncbi:hypothetical protein [Chryseobacterium indoltheticum]